MKPYIDEPVSLERAVDVRLQKAALRQAERKERRELAHRRHALRWLRPGPARTVLLAVRSWLDDRHERNAWYAAAIKKALGWR